MKLYTRICTNRHLTLSIIFSIIISASIALPTYGATYNWDNTGTEYWTNSANWGGTVPGAGDTGNIADSGTAIVDSTVSISRMENPGVNGDSTLRVIAGGDLTATVNLEIGRDTEGTLVVDGGSVTVASILFNGHFLGGTGNIIVTNGGSISASDTKGEFATANVYIYTNSLYEVTSGDFQANPGEMLIKGGTLKTSNGSNIGGYDGTFTMDGGLWTNSSAIKFSSLAGGKLTGTIDGNAKIYATELNIASTASSTGILSIANSTLETSSGHIYIAGNNGSVGELTVCSNSVVTLGGAKNIYMSNGTDRYSSLIIDNATVTNFANIYVGASAASDLIIRNGGVLAGSAIISLASTPNCLGSANLTVDNSTLNVSGDFYAASGENRESTVIITNNGVIRSIAAKNMNLGQAASSTSIVHVVDGGVLRTVNSIKMANGIGSTCTGFMNNGSLITDTLDLFLGFGEDSIANLTATNNSTIQVARYIRFGQNPGSQTTLNMDGGTFRWSDVTAGQTLVFSENATAVSTSVFNNVDISAGAGTSRIYVGKNGDADVTFSGGCTFTNIYELYVGNEVASDSSCTLSGSTLDLSNYLYVGNLGDGTMTVGSGATVNVPSILIAKGITKSGSLTITDSDVTVGTIEVGRGSGAQATITQNGGTVDIYTSHLLLGQNTNVSESRYTFNSGILKVKQNIYRMLTTAEFIWNGGTLAQRTWASTMPPLTNTAGILSPAYTNTGRMDIDTAYVCSASGTNLHIDIGGITKGSGYEQGLGVYDYVDINGNATLAGYAKINVMPGAVGVLNYSDTFNIMHVSGTIFGGFVNLTNGGTYTTDDGIYTFSVTVTETDITLGEFLLAGAPVITTDAESNLKSQTVIMNCTLISTGSTAATVWVYYGDNDGGKVAADWDYTNIVGVAELGTVSTYIGDLTSSTDYYYNYYASNSIGGTWGSPSEPFTTGSATLTPSWQLPGPTVGDYATTFNWDGSPGAGENPRISNGGTALLSTAGEVADNFYVGDIADLTSTLIITNGGDLTLSLLAVGFADGATGILTVAGGDLTVAGTLKVGNATGATGILTVDGGNVTAAADMAVGSSSGSTGILNVAGGNLTVVGNVYNNNVDGYMQLNVTDGTLKTGYLRAANGTSEVNHSGGIITNTSISTYNYPSADGATLNYNQSGGDRYSASGWNQGNTGSHINFDLSGGTFRQTGQYFSLGGINGTCSVTVSDGEMSIVGRYGARIGAADGSTSTFAQSGGIVTIGETSTWNTDYLTVGYNATVSNATYTLSGGILKAVEGITRTAGAKGGFIFTGGTLAVRNYASTMNVLTNAGGILSPGYTQAGRCDIDTDYEITSTAAELVIGLGGTTPADENVYQSGAGYYDTVDVNGNAALNGKLKISYTDDFERNNSDTFTILTATSISGAFANVNVVDGTVISADEQWVFTYEETATSITISNAIPFVARPTLFKFR